MEKEQQLSLRHHGILGQKWGIKNGPPYPLSGTDYSKDEISSVYKARKFKRSIYNKKHFDSIIKENSVITTLSYDKDRVKGADMYYAATSKADKSMYNALFNRPIYEEGKKVLKYRLNNIAKHNIAVASEDSGVEAFVKLYSNDRDFSNFVNDPKRMEKMFVASKYKFKGYREAKTSLESVRKNISDGEKPKLSDLRKVYRMYNYTIPSQGNDTYNQRQKFFSELKSRGYGALLDTNDAIYGGFKAERPVIVIDNEQFVLKDCARVSTASKTFDQLVFSGRKFLGI